MRLKASYVLLCALVVGSGMAQEVDPNPTGSPGAEAPVSVATDVTGAKITSFLKVLEQVKGALPPTDSSPAVNSNLAEPSSDELVPFTAQLQYDDIRTAADEAAKQNGFDGAEQWAAFGDRLANIFAVVEKIDTEKISRNEIEAVSKARTKISGALE